MKKGERTKGVGTILLVLALVAGVVFLLYKTQDWIETNRYGDLRDINREFGNRPKVRKALDEATADGYVSVREYNTINQLVWLETLK